MDEGKAKFWAALAAAQAEYGDLKRTGVNPHFRSSYSTVSDIMDAVRPAFAKHGLGIIFRIGAEADPPRTTVNAILFHKDGHSIESEFAFPTPSGKGGGIDPQATGSMLTYVSRYVLRGIVGPLDDGTDDDGNAAQERSAQPAPAAPQRPAPRPPAPRQAPQPPAPLPKATPPDAHKARPAPAPPPPPATPDGRSEKVKAARAVLASEWAAQGLPVDERGNPFGIRDYGTRLLQCDVFQRTASDDEHLSQCQSIRDDLATRGQYEGLLSDLVGGADPASLFSSHFPNNPVKPGSPLTGVETLLLYQRLEQGVSADPFIDE